VVAERASRLAAGAADAARATAAEVEVLRGSHSSSISTDDSADVDLDLLEREAAQGRVAQWAAAHAHKRDGSPDRRGCADGAPRGGAHGGGAPGRGAHGGGTPEEACTAVAYGSMESAAFTGDAALSPWFSTVVTTSIRLLSGTSAPAVGGLPSPRPTTSNGLR
jgi:hypothetical protein